MNITRSGHCTRLRLAAKRTTGRPQTVRKFVIVSLNCYDAPMNTTASPAADRPSNRLVHETSPYLKQHAHNPVDWYPWGPEALETARRENKPILLSIGYAACHW